MPRVSSFFWCECPNLKKVGTFPALEEYSCSYSMHISWDVKKILGSKIKKVPSPEQHHYL